MAFNPEKCLKFINIGDNPITIGIDESKVDMSGYMFSPDGAMWTQGMCEIQPGGQAYCYGRQYPTREIAGSNPFRMFGDTFIEISGNITSLVDEGAGEHPSETPYAGGFIGLFQNCTQIKKVSNSLLSQSIIAPRLYESLFEGCVNLEETPRGFFPNLPDPFEVRELDDMFKNMFCGCSNLTKIYYPYSDWYNATSGWVTDVADYGEFYAPEDLSIDWGENGVPEGWDYIPYKDPFNPEKCLKITVTNAMTEISIAPSPVDGSHYEFSKDGKVWVQDKISLSYDESAYCRGTNYPGGEGDDPSIFRVTEGSWAMLELSGSIMSLIDDGAGEAIEITENSAFYALFRECPVYKISSGLLPATVLTSRCYSEMFSRTILTELPENLLPAVNLPTSCYLEMFYDIYSLTKVSEGVLVKPESVEDSVYARMFWLCNSLSEIYCEWEAWPSESLATQMWVEQVADSGIFHCPSSLEEIYDTDHIPEGWTVDKPEDPFNPEKCLKLKALADNCKISLNPSRVDGSHYKFSQDGETWYQDSITLNEGETCYVKGTNYTTTIRGGGINSFTFTGPVEIVSGNISSLLDNGLGERTVIGDDTEYDGLYYLFYDCANLKKINADLLPFTTLTTQCCAGLFYGCTGLTSLPVGLLPAAKQARGCFEEMFSDCTGLTCVPEGFLPEELSAEGSIQYMFSGCSSLKEIHVSFTKWNNATKEWVNGVAASGDFYCPEELSEEFGISKIPSGWRVHKPTPPVERTRCSMTFFNKIKAGGYR